MPTQKPTRYNHWRPAKGNAFTIGTLHPDGRLEERTTIEGEPAGRCRCGGGLLRVGTVVVCRKCCAWSGVSNRTLEREAARETSRERGAA